MPKQFASCLLIQWLLIGIVHAGSPLRTAPRITEDPSDVTVMRNDPATLRCSFTGDPTPEVTWYRDGEALEPRGHRLVLPDGALFFLRVSQGRGRNGGDAGTYWCVARNSLGVARSRNATLTVAYLQPDFRRAPEVTRSVVGEAATLHCQPPRGQPEPKLTWRRNGVPIVLRDPSALHKERLHIGENGDLMIDHVVPSDEGKYQCVAHNMAATRESPIVSLSVHVRPTASIFNKEAIVLVGDLASFKCNASGDPAPSIVWRRLDAPLPADRARATGNRSGLKIETVTLGDAGQYMCEVENAVGRATALATLTVLMPPAWKTQPPADIRVQADARRHLIVDCSATGTPTPHILWRREGIPLDEFNATTGGGGGGEHRWKTLRNGSLSIEQLEPQDSGRLYCAAINAGGSLLAHVNLQISAAVDSVPAFFQIGPANQTLPIRSPALFQCQSALLSSGTNESTLPVYWTRNASLVVNQSHSMNILPSGWLQIDHLQMQHSGRYTCWTNATANGNHIADISSWTATLTVENPINPNVVFNRAPSDPLAVPGPPSEPVLLNQTQDSVSISWQSSSRMGASPLLGYTVEAYIPGVDATDRAASWTWGAQRTNRTWLVLARRLKSTNFVVSHLKPAASIIFIIRAENSHGLSLPSPVSRWMQTLPSRWIQDPADLAETRELLSAPLLKLLRAVALNSTSVQLDWDIIDGESYIEGLYLFRLTDAEEAHETPAYVINDATAMTFVVTQLQPDTNYTFFVIPFYGSVEGRPSNSKLVKTNQDAPSGYPQNVTVRQFNETSVLVQWLPPTEHQRNGVISAYQISVYSAETNAVLANLTLSSTSTSIAIGGLEGGTRYMFRTAASTPVGTGPLSPPVVAFIEKSATSPIPMNDQGVNSFPINVAQEFWMIMLVGGTLLVLLLTIILVVIVRRKKSCRGGGSAVGGGSSRTTTRSGQSLLWPLPSEPWSSCDPSKDVHPQLGPDYAEVFHHANPMSSFASQPTAAYASTTLIRNSSSLPFRYQTAGRSIPQLDSSYSNSVRNSSQQLVPNWLELLPPPPQHPPPPIITPDCNAKGDYPSFLTATLPSTIHTPSANPSVHYPFRSSFNAQSHPTLIPRNIRNSFQSNRSSAIRYVNDESQVEGLYATCTYDQIEPYPLSSYR